MTPPRVNERDPGSVARYLLSFRWDFRNEAVHKVLVDGGLPLWRLSVPSVAPPLALPGEELIEWGGALRWWRTDAEPAAIREAAARVGGHATLFRGGGRQAGVFAPLPPALLALHRRLKAELDPRGIFNPGRMYPDL